MGLSQAQVFVFYANVANSGPLLMIQSADGQTWSNPTSLGSEIKADTAPAPVVFNNNIYVFYKGAGADTTIYVTQSSDGQAWTTAAPLTSSISGAIATSAAPCAVVFNGVLYVFYAGALGNTEVWMTQFQEDDETWSAPVSLNADIATDTTPAAACFMNNLYIFYKGSAGNANIWIAQPTNSTDIGGPWSAPDSVLVADTPITTGAPPGSAVFTPPGGVSGVLYLFYSELGTDNTPMLMLQSTDGKSWSTPEAPMNPGINTNTAPAPIVFNGSNGAFYVFYKGSSGDPRMWFAQSTDGIDWANPSLLDQQNSSAAPGAVVFPQVPSTLDTF